MSNKSSFVTVMVLLMSLLLVATALAANTKYTFNDVEIDGQTIEIEAAVKDNKKSDFSSCSYYSDDYQEYLGQYRDDVLAGQNADQVLDFCLANFDDRTD